MNPYGPLVDQVQTALASLPFAQDYRAGRIGQAEYVAALEREATAVEAALGGSRHLRMVASRYPADFDAHVRSVTAALHEQGLIPSMPAWDAFEAYRTQLRARLDHGRNRTYIHHDEAGVLYFVAAAVQPRHVVAAGSYYGYWAAWALPGLTGPDARAVWIDPNPTVCELARHNAAALGYGHRVTVLAETAESVVPRLTADIDLVLLDASGAGDSANPAYRGKGIYAFLAEALYPLMRPGALLVAHNDYLPGVGDNPVSHGFVEHGARQLERFHAFCASHFRRSFVAATPDGFGVYLK